MNNEIVNEVSVICDKVKDAKLKFYLMGMKAKYLYVGNEEYTTLKNSGVMELNASYYDKETKLIGGRFFKGLKVMRVNQIKHMNITS